MDARDARDDVRWLTYAELGQARGISTASATRLAFRRKWRRQHGNDGAARVAVPVGEDRPADDDRMTKQGDVTPVIRVLEAAVTSLTERAEAADRRADQAEARADRAETRADQAFALAQQYVAELASERADAKQARAQASAARTASLALQQADAARRARGVLARLRVAWRGE